jgi:hypothetical protein
MITAFKLLQIVGREVATRLQAQQSDKPLGPFVIIRRACDRQRTGRTIASCTLRIDEDRPDVINVCTSEEYEIIMGVSITEPRLIEVLVAEIDQLLAMGGA